MPAADSKRTVNSVRYGSLDVPIRELDVAIIGGGISGLVTAYRLASRPTHGRGTSNLASVRLFEATDRLGGLVQTERRGDWLFESGPDSLVIAKPSASNLCRELGLGSDLITPRSASTFSLVHHRSLHPLPAGFHLVAPTEPMPLLRSRLFSWHGKLRMLSEPWIRTRSATVGDADESVEAFVTRRFGHEAYDRVAEPVLAGLFVADADALSARRSLGPFVELELQRGSVMRGLRETATRSGRAQRKSRRPPPTQLTLKHGLGCLITRLIEEIPASWLALGCGVKAIEPATEDGGWQIETTAGIWRAREVVLACAAPTCHDLLQRALPSVARALAKLRFNSCVTVNAVYRRSDLKRLPSDFGFFVPRTEPYRILAATYSSEKFAGRAPAHDVVVRTFQGGARDPDALDLDDAALSQRSHEALAQLLGAAGPPLSSRVCRFRQSMPQFDVGHVARIAALQREVEARPGLQVIGSGMGEYGLPDCIQSGEEAAARIHLC